MRRAYSLLLAVVFVVVVSGVGVATLWISALGAHQTTQEFLAAQVRIFARSATEAAIFEIQKGSCATEFEFFYPQKEAFLVKSEVSVSYVGGCAGVNSNLSANLSSQAGTKSTNIAKTAAVVLTTTTFSNENASSPQIRFVKTTTQLP